MKTTGRTWTMIFAVGLTGVMVAAPAGRAGAEIPDPDETLEREWRVSERERGPGYRGPGVETRGGPAVVQWLQHLREEDPGEYERLEELRETDPVAFREELRGRLRERRMLQELRRRHPHLHEFIRGQPRTERDRMMRTMHELWREEPDWRPVRHPGFPTFPEARETVTEMRRLLEEYRKEPDPERREEIENQLREKTLTLYELREERQLRRIRDMEERLNRLKEDLDQQRERRDELIEDYLNALLRSAPERLLKGL